MGTFGRYLRLYGSFLRYCLVRELQFRANFVFRVVGTIGWLLFVLFFFSLVYRQTDRIGDWNQQEYLFFMGTGFLINSIVNGLFVDNCTRFAELVRTGNLDFALTKPVDEQFLLSFERVDWAEIPTVIIGLGMMGYSLVVTGTAVTLAGVVTYMAFLLAGVTILYSLLVTLSASSVWMVRNQSIYEMWWYVNQFARYPADIYSDRSMLGLTVHFTLTFILPVLLAINVPARFGMNKSLGWLDITYIAFAAIALLAASRWFFRYALSSYRSASS